MHGLANRSINHSRIPPGTQVVQVADGWRRRWDSNPRSFRLAVFKTAALNHSATPPEAPLVYQTAVSVVNQIACRNRRSTKHNHGCKRVTKVGTCQQLSDILLDDSVVVPLQQHMLHDHPVEISAMYQHLPESGMVLGML